MIQGARYTHTNIVARDWRGLAAFYERVLGCTPVPPERSYSGSTFEALTGIPGAALGGAHLRMPGGGDEGPTMEIFGYEPLDELVAGRVNRRGFTHIAFAVDSVADARAEVLAAGGGSIGEIVVLTTATGAQVTACYVTDPEGNIIELQSWSAPSAE